MRPGLHITRNRYFLKGQRPSKLFGYLEEDRVGRRTEDERGREGRREGGSERGSERGRDRGREKKV